MFRNRTSIWTFLLSTLMILLAASAAIAGEADIRFPDDQVSFLGGALAGLTILNVGLLICLIGMGFGIMQYIQTKNLPSTRPCWTFQTIWKPANLSFSAG